jgi:anthranilate synthase component 2
MILVIDNYDSFTYNLVHLVGRHTADIRVVRNDALDLAEIRALGPRAILLSPGPGRPDQAGVCLALIRELGPTTPILGVCLGHQAIGQAYGGRVVHAPHLMHGKTSPITHDGRGVFRDCPAAFEAGRYHSLVIDPASLPASLEVSARTADGIIMGVRHRSHPVEGIQFHPESVLTPCGALLIAAWVTSTGTGAR